MTPVRDPSLIDSPRSWRVAVASSALVAVSFGTMYTFGAFFDAMALDFDAGRGATSVVFGITAFLFFGTGAGSGFLADRWGARPLVMVGGTLFASGLFLTSRASELWHGYLTYGIGVGLGGGLFVSSLFAMSAAWFDRHRGIAQGIVATGSGIGTLALLPLAQRVIDGYGWRQAYVVLAIIAAVAFSVGSIFMHRPPVDPPAVASEHLRRVLSTSEFRRFGVCGALQSGSMLSAFAFIVPFATDRGVSSSHAALLVGVIGATSIVGRLVLAGCASRVGTVRMLQIAFLVQPIAFTIWLFSGGRLPVLVVFVVVLGVSYGGYVALVPLVAAHLFGVRGLGAIMGWSFLAGGVGSLIAPPLIGVLADTTASQVVPILAIALLSAAGAGVLLGLGSEPVDIEASVGPQS